MSTLRLVVPLLFPALLCAQTGSVSGRVTDAAANEGLPGVNVRLAGTSRGTTSDREGRFLLSKIPPGTYAVTFSLVGYARTTLTPVVVAADSTTHADVSLASLPIQTEPVVVTASRREQSLQDVPVSISSMDASTLNARNFVTVDDALRYIPGVNLTEYQVNIRGSSGYSRGAGSRVLLLVDGMPFLTGDTGEMNFETIPIGQVERIEVVKGASSALYGSSALGGVVNVLTRRIPDEPTTRVRAYGGFYGSPSFAAWDWKGGSRFLDGQAVTQSFRTGDLGMMVHVSRMADDGFRQNDFRRRYNAYVKTTLQLGLYEDLTVTGNLLHQRRGSFLYWKDLGHALVPPDAQQGDMVRSTRFFLSGQYRKTIHDALLLNAKALWFRNDWDDTIDTLTNASRSDVVRVDLQATWTPAEEQIVTFGIDGNLERVDADLFGNRTGGGVALYVQDEIALLPRVKLTVGARWDYQDRDSLAANSQVNPKAGCVYTPGPGTAVRASYGRGFRTPSVAEAFIVTQAGGLDIIPNPSLRPERSSSVEIGVSQLLGETALLDAALFQTEFRDLIEPRFVPSGGVLKGQFNNVTRARVQGMELSAKVGCFARALMMDAGYTYVYPRDLGLKDLLKYRPRHILYAGATARLGFLTLGADFRYLSKIERIDQEFTVFVNDAAAMVPVYVADVRLAADIAPAGVPVTATLIVNNLFQYNYVELIGNLLPPRTCMLTLDARF
jgi:outer membrane receptor for ferrienterochelin and colicins